MTGHIVQINISPGGVPKRPIAEAEVTPEGIRGDSWAHPQIHGGPNQALLLITSEGIGELIAQGYPVFPGALGENLTTHRAGPPPDADRPALSGGRRDA